MPKRIQRKRTKGWRMPPNTVYVGRPGKWGNPFSLLFATDSREQMVRLFRAWLLNGSCSGNLLPDAKVQLRGKDLACWCPLDKPCHADVLLEVANS